MQTNSNEIKWTKNGYTSFGGEYFSLFQSLDRMFLRLAAQVSANEHFFPVFISALELKKLDYFKSFPHLIHFPVSLNQDENNLKKFIESEHISESGEVKLTEIAPMCDCLTPAACYHFYITFQKQNLPQTKFVTTRAPCFRQEKFYEPLRRQRNFNMREIVCLGSSEQVKDFLENFQKAVSGIFAQLKIPISWDYATDPFFDPGQNPKFLMQQLDPVKKEMIYKKGTSEELSIGSVNFHKNYFGDAFAIQYQGQSAFSGCVAFGMERWIYAVLQTFGENSKAWPDFDKVVVKLG